MNIITSNTQTMSSREIAELTGKQVSHIHRDFKAMADDLGFPSESILMPSPDMDLGFSYELDGQKRIRTIWLNRELTLTLVSGYNAKLRNVIIKRWQELESKDQFQIPQTLPEALQLAADLALKIEQDKPKIDYHDRVLATENGITTTEVASELGMSAIKLNRLLEAMKIQRKIGGRWVLTAANLNQGYDVECTHVDDSGKSRHSLKWTEKGRKFIHELATDR